MDRRAQCNRSLVRFGQMGWSVEAVAVALRSDRHWLRGDVFVASTLTGAERIGVTGVSSKGRHLVDFWVSVRRRAPEVRIVSVPSELATGDAPWSADSAHGRAIVDFMCKVTAALGVGTGIPELSQEGAS